jgi:hypothetical protein
MRAVRHLSLLKRCSPQRRRTIRADRSKVARARIARRGRPFKCGGHYTARALELPRQNRGKMTGLRRQRAPGAERRDGVGFETVAFIVDR